MKTIHIDCLTFTSKDAIHPYLKKTFDFPEYYGENLDALWDCLTEVNEPTKIYLKNTDALKQLGKYGTQLLQLFEEIEDENHMIVVAIED